jgi:hypothetical protein
MADPPPRLAPWIRLLGWTSTALAIVLVGLGLWLLFHGDILAVVPFLLALVSWTAARFAMAHALRG